MKKIVATIIVIIISTVIGTVALAKSGRVTSNSLNVRDGATTSANSIGKLEKNATVDIINEEDGWYKIDYDEKEAYVSKNYIEEIGDSSENQENTVNTENNEKINSESKLSINEQSELSKEADLRVLPLLNATKLNTLEVGKKFTVILDYGKWLYIEADNDRGWIISQDIELVKNEEVASDGQNENENENETTNTVETENNSDNKDSNETETSESSNDFDEDSNEYPKTMYVNADSVNVRSSASTSSRAISGVTRNESIKVIAKEGDWYKVDTEDGTGYIKSNLLSSTKN